ncbi:MAG: hypothetical protein FD152_32 [Xanthobacteraceae bacterium]|nr:MAG: hypothetical protein FD152_32 [Xanthobacteraceae bacterium]
MKRVTRLPIAAASPDSAHPGDHGTSGLAHLLTQPDHLALMALASGVVVVKRRSQQ